jgi:hypothetical protein
MGRNMYKVVALLALLAGLASAQTNNYICGTGDVSLVAAGTAATIQQPATGGKQVVLQWATVYCSVVCAATQSSNGTAATATTWAPVAVPGNSTVPAVSTFWIASNAGVGIVLAVDHVPAGGTFTFDLSKIKLAPTSTGNNYTIAVSAITGVANIKIGWGESN